MVEVKNLGKRKLYRDELDKVERESSYGFIN